MGFDLEKFKNLTNLSAVRVSESMSKFTGLETNVSITKVYAEKLKYEFKDLGSDSYVIAIQLPIRGEVEGSTLLLFPKEIAMKLSSVLTKTDSSSASGFDEMEISALKEVGNIVCGSFLTVISNELKIHIVEHLPVFLFDTVSTVLQQLHAQVLEKEENALMIEVRFKFDEINISGYVIFMFGVKQMAVFEKALERFNA